MSDAKPAEPTPAAAPAEEKKEEKKENTNVETQVGLAPTKDRPATAGRRASKQPSKPSTPTAKDDTTLVAKIDTIGLIKMLTDTYNAFQKKKGEGKELIQSDVFSNLKPEDTTLLGIKDEDKDKAIGKDAFVKVFEGKVTSNEAIEQWKSKLLPEAAAPAAEEKKEEAKEGEAAAPAAEEKKEEAPAAAPAAEAAAAAPAAEAGAAAPAAEAAAAAPAAEAAAEKPAEEKKEEAAVPAAEEKKEEAAPAATEGEKKEEKTEEAKPAEEKKEETPAPAAEAPKEEAKTEAKAEEAKTE